MAVEGSKRELKGNAALDEFKRWHKEGSKHYYGMDGDFVLVTKLPAPGIVAFLDYKKTLDEPITFAEVVAYNHLLSVGIPVYIVISQPPFVTFTIQKYLGGDYKPFPPICQTQTEMENVPAREFWAWQGRLRSNFKQPPTLESFRREVNKLNNDNHSLITQLTSYQTATAQISLIIQNLGGTDKPIDERESTETPDKSNPKGI